MRSQSTKGEGGGGVGEGSRSGGADCSTIVAPWYENGWNLPEVRVCIVNGMGNKYDEEGRAIYETWIVKGEYDE